MGNVFFYKNASPDRGFCLGIFLVFGLLSWFLECFGIVFDVFGMGLVSEGVKTIGFSSCLIVFFQ